MRIEKIERSMEVTAEKKRYEVGLLVHCCILYNICEVHHDEFDEQWLNDVEESSISSSSGSTLPSTSTGSSIRNALANNSDDNLFLWPLTSKLYYQ